VPLISELAKQNRKQTGKERILTYGGMAGRTRRIGSNGIHVEKCRRLNESDQRGDEPVSLSRRYRKVVIQWVDILQWINNLAKLLGSKLFTRIHAHCPTASKRTARPSSAEPLEDPLLQ
jgi:hypothetical protein